MREYQKKYIANLQEVIQLNSAPPEVPQDIAAFVKERGARKARLREIAKENTSMLRQHLFPLLDDIVSAGKEDIAQLEDFAAHLVQGADRLDLVLSYHLHNALLAYARQVENRDMLIRELYATAMDLFYMQDLLQYTGHSPYRLKMGMLFGEAASYIKQYDEIQDTDTRGYIHRSMANLALVYSDLNEEDGRRKMAAIRRSLQILEDPVYHEKTPDLPWELFIYKSHQERTTGLGLLRAGMDDPQILQEVMVSAEYVIDRQKELSQKHGSAPALRWRYAYEAAQYHCGVRPLSYLLEWMEDAYMDRDENDYSNEGFYQNMFLPALYAHYVNSNPEYAAKKKEVMGLMYRRMTAYARRMPGNHQMSESTLKCLLACLQTFVEYPDGILEKDFIIELVICRDPDAYVSSRMAAEIAMMMVDRALEIRPQALEGTFGCQTPEALRARREELRKFVFEGCILHNVGLLALGNLVRRIGRSWLEEEIEIFQYHVHIGQSMLAQGSSTQPYIPAALGHHSFYDGSAEGYPQGYSRQDDPNRSLTDFIFAAIYFMRITDNWVFYTQDIRSLDEALELIRSESGKRLSPEAVQMMWELKPALGEYLKNGLLAAYQEAFQLLQG